MPQIKVKPLQWAADKDGPLYASTPAYAPTPWGDYILIVDEGGEGDGPIVEWCGPQMSDTEWIRAESVESAKAACQAHWEAAVMSCIEVEP